MNRRTAINHFVILSAAAWVLPSCGVAGEPLVKLKNMQLNASEVQTISRLADFILPKSNIGGANDVKAHEFTLKMVDDCYAPEKQAIFVAGLQGFEKFTRQKFNQSFSDCSAAQKNELLTALEKKQDITEDLQFFYETTKRHTVQAFTSSKEYMTDVLKYKMVPGSNFKGCVKLG